MIVNYLLIYKCFFSRLSICLGIDLNLICILNAQYHPRIKAIVNKLKILHLLTEETWILRS